MNDQNEQAAPSELDLLKQRARMMGITFSNNIGVDSLKARIAEKLAQSEGQEAIQDIGNLPVDQDGEAHQADQTQTTINGFDAAAQIAEVRDTTPATAPRAPNPHLDRDGDGRTGGSLPKKLTLRQKQIKEQTRLVRCRIQNLDPKKANLPGEVFTVANEVIGTIRKFVPFGEVTDDGYHVPYIIYRHLEGRRFLNIRTTKDRRTGAIRTETGWAKEFAIEVLPPLTPEELARLAQAQMAAGSVE